MRLGINPAPATKENKALQEIAEPFVLSVILLFYLRATSGRSTKRRILNIYFSHSSIMTCFVTIKLKTIATSKLLPIVF